MRKELMTLGAAAGLVLCAAAPASAIPIPTDVTIIVDPEGGGVTLLADTDPSGGQSTPRPATHDSPPAPARPPRTHSGSPRGGGSGRPAKPRSVIEVRQEAMDEITLTKPKIGASPCLSAGAACTGTVGVPVWLWVGDGDGQLPSDSASAQAGAWDIKATATVVKVKWSLGDGQSTVCSGTGTKYDADRDGWSAPECGFAHGWKEPGTYTLTATYVWQLAWTGDETGSMTQAMSSTQEVTVGELQSVATRH